MEISTNKRIRFTKETMLEQAILIINRKGYENVTVEQICEELGVTKGSFYHHFKSKNDLIFQRYKLLEGQISDYYNKRINLPAKEQLKAMFDWYIDYFSNKNFYEVGIILQFSMDKKWKNFGVANIFQKKIMTNIIRRGLEEKVFRKGLDPTDVTEFIYFNIYGILVQWISSPEKVDIELNLNHYYQVYLLPILGFKKKQN